MTRTGFISPDDIRTSFSAAMSAMYRQEVPAYGQLMALVARANNEMLAADSTLHQRLAETDTLARISEERHGAIRVGTAAELSMMRRVFAVMGMVPVGYYDLSTAGVPVHSTAFRPIEEASLRHNPFRVFTSLLRLDLIEDQALREEAASILAGRRIFTARAEELVNKAESSGGLTANEAGEFVGQVLETFRWHDAAIVDRPLYDRLHAAHRLVADVVSFKGPHINHLTPRTLDIDKVQSGMAEEGIAPKAVIEGPPKRRCPILLRQTSFKALEEAIAFKDGDGTWQSGTHTARFGEIEQRGIALTPKGRALYDRLLGEARKLERPAADGANAAAYVSTLAKTFRQFPDSWDEIRQQGLGYFSYSLTEKGRSQVMRTHLEQAIDQGLIQFDPVVYEDFLPVSAAGIFQSNLGDDAAQQFVASPNQLKFEEELGAKVIDEFAHYAAIERDSINRCARVLEAA